MKVTGNSIVTQALAISRADASAVSAWLINQQPSHARADLVSEVRDAIRMDRLSGGPLASCSAPSIFDQPRAQQVWKDLCRCIKMRTASPSDGERHISNLSPFFKPDAACTPIAFASQALGFEETIGLTPGEVRRSLGISREQVVMLVRFVEKCLEATESIQLDVAVLPYADTLTIPALLYSVSDRFADRLRFHLASFFRDIIQTENSNYGFSGRYHMGYTTKYQYANEARAIGSDKCAITYVFSKPFTRSLVLRQLRPFKKGPPPIYDFVSFVGQFAGDTKCTFDWSEPPFPRIAIPQNVELQDLSGRLDPIVDWEIDLLLLHLSKSPEAADSQASARAIYVSTDAHLWATYCGLVSTHNNSGKNSVDFIFPGLSSSGAAYWTPQHLNGDDDEDVESQLCWFMPKDLADSSESRAVEAIAQRLVTSPVNDLLVSSDAGLDSRASIRATAERIGRCLMAPLLAAHPFYRGPLMATPPEQWLVKLRGPDAHIHHTPDWRFKAQAAAEIAEKDIAGPISGVDTPAVGRVAPPAP